MIGFEVSSFEKIEPAEVVENCEQSVSLRLNKERRREILKRVFLHKLLHDWFSKHEETVFVCDLTSDYRAT